MQPKKLSFDDSGNLTYLSDNLSGMRAPAYETPGSLEKGSSMSEGLESYYEFDQPDINDQSDVDHSDIVSEGLDYDQICEAIDNADLSTLYDLKSDLENEGFIGAESDTSSDGDQKVLTR